MERSFAEIDANRTYLHVDDLPCQQVIHDHLLPKANQATDHLISWYL
jgi:hypothetical protein